MTPFRLLLAIAVGWLGGLMLVYVLHHDWPPCVYYHLREWWDPHTCYVCRQSDLERCMGRGGFGWALAARFFRYTHGSITSMIEACEQALAVDVGTRRRIYDYFNREGTVGPVTARLIAEFYNSPPGHQDAKTLLGH